MVVRPARRSGEGGDAAAADADIPYAVETGLRIHHPAVGDHQIECLGRKWCDRNRCNSNKSAGVSAWSGLSNTQIRLP